MLSIKCQRANEDAIKERSLGKPQKGYFFSGPTTKRGEGGKQFMTMFLLSSVQELDNTF